MSHMPPRPLFESPIHVGCLIIGRCGEGRVMAGTVARALYNLVMVLIILLWAV